MSVTVVDFHAAHRERWLARLDAMRRHPSNAARPVAPRQGRAAASTPPGPNFPGDRSGLSLATGDTAHRSDRGDARRRARTGTERGAGCTTWEGSTAPLEVQGRGGVA